MVHVDGRLDAVSGQVLITASPVSPTMGTLTPQITAPPAQRRADAYRPVRDHSTTATFRCSAPSALHVVVHLSIDALEGRAGRPCELDNTGVITPETARRLACDAKVTRVITGPESAVLDVGRTTRVISPALRLALMTRDRCCVVDGCGAYAAGVTLTMWSIGPTADPPISTILCCFAPATTP